MPSSRPKCLGKMKEISKSQGRTVLFVSHNLNAIVQLCHSAVLLRQGKVAMIGPSIDVMRAYAAQAEVSNSVDLTEHPNRPPMLRPVIRRVELLSGNEDSKPVFFPEVPVEVRFRIRCPHPITSPKIALAVNNWRGDRIFAVATYLSSGFASTMDEGEATVVASFNLPALAAGSYLVDVSMMDGEACSTRSTGRWLSMSRPRITSRAPFSMRTFSALSWSARPGGWSVDPERELYRDRSEVA